MQPHFECSGSIGCVAEQRRQQSGLADHHEASSLSLALNSLRAGVHQSHQHQHHRHNRRFSSSQAHLQSLTPSALSDVALDQHRRQQQQQQQTSNTLGRKAATPSSGAVSSSSSAASAANPQSSPNLLPSTGEQPHRHLVYRSHNSLATSGHSQPASTKPMTSAPPASGEQRSASGRRQQEPTAAQLPPPYSLEQAPICHQPGSIIQQATSESQVQSSATTAASVQLSGGQQQQQQQQSQATSFAHFPLLQMQANYQLLQHHRPYLVQQAAAGNHPNGAAQAPASLAFLGPTSKSKSCLACADISIKWYIVVIALLGLICALIGTIVGAVHSVERDYFSLALLLLGVGLVLIAVSWIGLRITMNTYKSHRGAPAPGQTLTAATTAAAAAALAAALHQQQQQQQPHTNGQRYQQPVRPPPPPLRHQRFHGQQQYQMAQGALHAMAAAAASAAATAHRLEGASACGHSATLQRYQRARASLLRGFKQRLPRRLARLISASSPPETGSQAQAATAQTGELSAGANCSLRQPAPTAAHLSSSSRHQAPISELTADSAEGQRQSAAAAASVAALASLLQHQNQHPLLFPGSAVPSAGLAPPYPHPFASVLFGHLAPHLHDPSFRPPPPSYSAAMQEQRMRMLLQERAALHQLQQQARPLAPQPPLPPAPNADSVLLPQGDQSPAASNGRTLLSLSIEQKGEDNEQASRSRQTATTDSASGSSARDTSSTIVNIDAGETTICRPFAGDSSQRREETDEASTSSTRRPAPAHAEVIGYL